MGPLLGDDDGEAVGVGDNVGADEGGKVGRAVGALVGVDVSWDWWNGDLTALRLHYKLSLVGKELPRSVQFGQKPSAESKR
jgi:hypothetical protein